MMIRHVVFKTINKNIVVLTLTAIKNVIDFGNNNSYEFEQHVSYTCNELRVRFDVLSNRRVFQILQILYLNGKDGK